MNPKNPNFRTIEDWEEICEQLVAELAQYKSDYVAGNLSAARMENARLTEELEQAKKQLNWYSDTCKGMALDNNDLSFEIIDLKAELARALEQLGYEQSQLSEARSKRVDDSREIQSLKEALSAANAKCRGLEGLYESLGNQNRDLIAEDDRNRERIIEFDNSLSKAIGEREELKLLAVSDSAKLLKAREQFEEILRLVPYCLDEREGPYLSACRCEHCVAKEARAALDEESK